MMRARRLFVLFALVGGAHAVGCATGGSPGEDTGIGGGGDGGGGTDAGVITDAQFRFDARLDARVDSGQTIADAQVQADAAPPVDSGTVTNCLSTATCQNVTRQAMTISGDTGAQTSNLTGSTSTWVRVRVTEDYDGLDGIYMSFRATLTSPPGANFDLFLYYNSGSDSLQCASISGSSMNASGNDVVDLMWGEGLLANGSDDDRDVSIEIRHISGMCSASNQWNLALIGDQ